MVLHDGYPCIGFTRANAAKSISGLNNLLEIKKPAVAGFQLDIIG